MNTFYKYRLKKIITKMKTFYKHKISKIKNKICLVILISHNILKITSIIIHNILRNKMYIIEDQKDQKRIHSSKNQELIKH